MVARNVAPAVVKRGTCELFLMSETREVEKLAVASAVTVASNEEASDSDPELQAEMVYAKEHSSATVHMIELKHHMHHFANRRRAKSESIVFGCFFSLIAVLVHRLGGNLVVNGVVHVPRSVKNQRRSRSGRGKGLAKKGLCF
ncbi:unnamed protein product [Soboliphyme baturini]|uniref:Transmembrane protein n=1 Tax=Soboliphyme baturini TaxID=241478 RepID=A0A183IF18_9BILA|nr:unnamed protein product [Soboliphyme baturini]